MNRRKFTQAMATAALGAVAPALPAASRSGASSAAQAQPLTGGPFGISIMLWTVFNKLPFEQRLEKVAEAGFTNVELVGEYKNWTAADFAGANAARKRLGLHFDATAGLGHGVANPTHREPILAEFKQAFTPMESLGIPAMIVLSGNVDPAISRQAQHESCIETLKRMAAMVEGKQIEGQPAKILLECIDPEENPKIYLSSAEEAVEIVRKVNHPQVRFLYDLFHEQIGHGNLIEKLEKNIDVVDLIHIADVPGRHEPGTGEINFVNIYRTLGKLKYKGMVAMEFYPTGDPIPMLRQAIKDAWAQAAM